MTGDRILEAAHPLERDAAIAPALKKGRPRGERAIVGFDRFRPPVQRHEEIGAIDVCVHQIRLMRDRTGEALQSCFGAAGLLERSTEKIVSGRMLGRELDDLAQEIDGFRETLELHLCDAEQAERVDVLRLERQDLRIARGRLRNSAAAVHVQAVLQ